MDVKTHVPEVEESKTPKLEMIFSDPDVTFNLQAAGSYENTGCSEEDIGSDDGDDDDEWIERKGRYMKILKI